MKVRLVGPPDIIELWAARFAELGIGGRTYPSRYADGQLRWYGEIDDRVAASIAVVDHHRSDVAVRRDDAAPAPRPSSILPARTARRKRRP